MFLVCSLVDFTYVAACMGSPLTLSLSIEQKRSPSSRRSFKLDGPELDLPQFPDVSLSLHTKMSAKEPVRTKTPSAKQILRLEHKMIISFY